ncbi:MAG: hypothetical protein QOH39_981 [Verrucomicrobiota bacterium]
MTWRLVDIPDIKGGTVAKDERWFKEPSMKLKNLNKRIRRLVARIAKDTKKVAKLRLKLAAPKARKKKRGQPKKKVSGSTKPVAAPKKRKRRLTPEARAKLAARMKERWAAKRAASGSPPGANAAADLSSGANTA